jgi:hypothetical protein
MKEEAPALRSFRSMSAPKAAALPLTLPGAVPEEEVAIPATPASPKSSRPSANSESFINLMRDHIKAGQSTQAPKPPSSESFRSLLGEHRLNPDDPELYRRMHHAAVVSVQGEGRRLLCRRAAHNAWQRLSSAVPAQKTSFTKASSSSSASDLTSRRSFQRPPTSDSDQVPMAFGMCMGMLGTMGSAPPLKRAASVELSRAGSEELKAISEAISEEPPEELKTIIDKTATFVARNGPDFEMRIKNEQDHAKFSFLHANDPFHSYYRSKLAEFSGETRAPRSPARLPARLPRSPKFPISSISTLWIIVLYQIKLGTWQKHKQSSLRHQSQLMHI